MSEFFLKIVNMSISAGWLVLVVLLLRLVLKKAPKWVSILLWGFVAVRLISPFLFESMLSLIPSAETISPEIMMDPTPEFHIGISSLNSVINSLTSQSLTPNPGDSANPLQVWIPIAAAVWLVGFAGMLAYTAVSYLLLRRTVATAVLLKSNIFQSEHVDSPFVLGISKPKIYLPFQMDGQNLEHVVAHEQAHIRRKDHWWKPIGFLLLALHWFNPLIWLGYILLCRDIELACDEKVIKQMDNENRADYTQALVACSVSRRRIAACPLAFGEVGVKARVKSVMHYKKPAFWVIAASVIICIAVAVCFLTNPEQENRWGTERDKLSKEQIALMEAVPYYFGLDASNGLDVYVWQMAPGSYYFGLLPHTDTPRDWSSVMELVDLRGVNADQMRTILSAYDVEQEKIYVIPWQNPISSYIGYYWLIIGDEDMEQKRNDYVENIRKMLFAEK